jgi:ABC-type Fe3+-hydroxamate transport system substrate-binding protein
MPERRQTPPRIVSLVPSLTELLFDLGLGAQVVGRTRYCVHPRALVGNVPVVGGTKDVDLALVAACRPTHVLVNPDENRRETFEALRRSVPSVLVVHPLEVSDNLTLFELLGRTFDAREAAARLAGRLRQELAACAARTWPRERVLYLVWRRPWMTVAADTYIARALALVGWEVPHGPGGETGAARYPEVADLPAAVAQVSRVLLSTEPYRFGERHVSELARAGPGTPIHLIDGEMTGWYGSRAIAGLAYLRAFRARLLGASALPASAG